MLKGVLAVLFVVVTTHVAAGNQAPAFCGKDGISNTIDCRDGSAQVTAIPNAESNTASGASDVLEFGFTSFSRFRKANFIVGQLLVEGERCHRAVSQEGSLGRACSVFIARTKPGAEFSRSLQVVLETLRDDRAFYERHLSEFRKLSRMAEEVNSHLKFVQTYTAE